MCSRQEWLEGVMLVTPLALGRKNGGERISSGCSGSGVDNHFFQPVQ